MWQAHQRLFDMQHSCVELEHEHGAEDDPDVMYSSGNDEPHRGFGHLAFLTDDVYQASEDLLNAGVSFKKKPGIA
ncbi:MAG: VOC family protein [Bacteroidota bacterium]